MHTVLCHVVSAEEEIYSGEVVMLSARGQLGELGIAPGHTPLLTPLIPGPVTLSKSNGEEDVVYVSGGMLEVQPDVITVLADTAVRAKDVDEAAALEAHKHAKEALENASSEMDYSTAIVQLAQAAAQIRSLQKIKQKLGG